LSRLVRKIDVKDSAGSQIVLYEYEDVVVRRLLGLVPWRSTTRRYVLDTGEAVERTPDGRGFRVRSNGEPLVTVEPR
jgi:hypothetical protein